MYSHENIFRIYYWYTYDILLRVKDKNVHTIIFILENAIFQI